MTSPNELTLLQRLRSTPKSIRRRFKISQEKSNLANDKTSKTVFNTEQSPTKKSVGTENLSFNCRYLGRRTVYTLKPEDCYEFALNLASSPEKQCLKVSLDIEPKFVEVRYQSVSSQNSKYKSKHSQSIASPLFIRKNGRSGDPRPASDCHAASCTTVFDFDTCQNRPVSADGCALYSSLLINESNNNSPLTKSLETQKQILNLLETQRGRSHTLNGLPERTNDLSQSAVKILDPEKILLHEIAYCVTVPEKPRLFLLTSRGKEGLICRVFQFSTREKAQSLKVALADQFHNAYMEWQLRTARRTRRLSYQIEKRHGRNLASDFIYSKPDVTSGVQSSISGAQSLSKVTESPNDLSLKNVTDSASRQYDSEETSSDEKAFSSSEEEGDLSEEDSAGMHREFTRRASCLIHPEQLTVGGDEMIASIKDHIDVVLNGEFSSDDLSDSESDSGD